MNKQEHFVETLRSARRAGVYRVPTDGAAAFESAVRALGFALARADLTGCRDKDEFLRRVGVALRFPSWFGHNWDALADCVSDMSWMPAEGYVLILDGADSFRAAAEHGFLTALEILDEAAGTWAADDVPFWTFVGLAPDDSIPLRRL